MQHFLKTPEYRRRIRLDGHPNIFERDPVAQSRIETRLGLARGDGPRVVGALALVFGMYEEDITSGSGPITVHPWTIDPEFTQRHGGGSDVTHRHISDNLQYKGNAFVRPLVHAWVWPTELMEDEVVFMALTCHPLDDDRLEVLARATHSIHAPDFADHTFAVPESLDRGANLQIVSCGSVMPVTLSQMAREASLWTNNVGPANAQA